MTRIPLVVGLFYCLLVVPAQAQDQDSAPTPDQAALIDKYVDAINARDADAVRALHNEKAFDCVDDRNREAAEATLTAPFVLTIPDDYQGAVYPSDGTDGPAWIRQLYRSAVPFTHQLQIQFRVGDRSSAMSHQMANFDGTWQLVFLCLSEKGVEWYNLAKTDPQKAREMAAQWAAEQSGE